MTEQVRSHSSPGWRTVPGGVAVDPRPGHNGIQPAPVPAARYDKWVNITTVILCDDASTHR